MGPAAAPALIVPAPVARALLEGEQVIDLRPDAPPEGATRFWLCPLGDAADLKPAYRMAQELSTGAQSPPAGQVRIEGWAELAGVGQARFDADGVAALDGKTVLALSPGGDERVVLVLRAHRLVEPLTVAADLAGLPADPASLPSEPALSDVAFTARRDGLANALPGGLS